MTFRPDPADVAYLTRGLPVPPGGTPDDLDAVVDAVTRHPQCSAIEAASLSGAPYRAVKAAIQSNQILNISPIPPYVLIPNPDRPTTT